MSRLIHLRPQIGPMKMIMLKIQAAASNCARDLSSKASCVL